MASFVVRRWENKQIGLNPSDAEEMDLEIGDIVLVTDEMADETSAGKLLVDPAVRPGEVAMDRATMDSIFVEEGSEVSVRLFDEPLPSIQHVVFGIEAVGGKDPASSLLEAREGESDLLAFMDGRVVTLNQKFVWEGHQMNIEILRIEPPIPPGKPAVISREILGGFEYQSTYASVPFDAVLLIDTSASMRRADITVESITQTLEHLLGGLDSEKVRGFLARFKEGELVRRSDAAALSALIYLFEKVGRGRGEKIAIIPFSSSAKPLVFGDRLFFDVSVDTNLDGVAERVVDAVSFGLDTGSGTNLTAALKEAISICDGFRPEELKMVVVLTDGMPTEPDSSRKVLVNVTRKVAPRNDMVINAAGIGDIIDDLFLEKMVSRTRGSFIKVRNLNQLVEWYGELARSLRLRGVVREEQEGADTEEEGSEPGGSEDGEKPPADGGEGKPVQAVKTSKKVKRPKGGKGS